MPQSKPIRSGKIPGALERDSAPAISSDRPGSGSTNISGNLNESIALSSLKELIAAGDQRLDPMLATITDAARQLTGASGAALAMWKEGAMVCRARSGNTAPALGARLNAETGISGECLRTGKIQNCADTENDPLVDVEVCRSLGLRSIAVLPILGWRGINGILEVFSTKPATFTEPHIALLQQLAALAERARASQPHGASPSAPKLPSAIAKGQSSGLLPASDRVGDVALAFVGTRSRPLVLGAVGIAAITLLALVIWLGWRGPDDTEGKAQAATAGSVDLATVNALTAGSPGGDPVWKPNPGGESLFPLSPKPSAGSPVKFASKVDVIAAKVIAAKKSRVGQSPLLGDVADQVAAAAAVPREGPSSPTGASVNSRSTDSPYMEAASVEPSSIPVGSTNQGALNGVSSTRASLPGLAAPLSQGVSGGQLVHRVLPDYPAQALQLHLEGTVVLAAVIMEDGTVGDVKPIEGPATFVPFAVDAVKRWRYTPFELDGKPVKNEIKINVDFRFPAEKN